MPLTLEIASLTSTPAQREELLATTWGAERIGPMYRPVDPTMDVTIRASRVAEVIEVLVRLRGRFAFECSRCAEGAQLTVDTEFEHHFLGPGQLDAGGPDDDAFNADPDVSEHDGKQIDLEELCIQHVILALPEVPVCTEDCRGLCPSCGSDLNRDTCDCAPPRGADGRWAGLERIKIEPKA